MDLTLLAARIGRQYREPCDIMGAALWLVSKSFGERIFWQSTKGDYHWGWFRSDVNPHDVLQEDEVLDLIDSGHAAVDDGESAEPSD